MTGRVLIGIAVYQIVSLTCCDAGISLVSVVDVASGNLATPPACHENEFEEVEDLSCPPLPCSCKLPMRTSDLYDEIPARHSFQIKWVYSRSHLFILVNPELSLLDVHILAWVYLRGEVTEQAPESKSNYYVVRLHSSARWDVSGAIVRAKRHKMIIDAGRASFPYPYERYYKTKNSQTGMDSIDAPRK
jgi:hypothetical protein